MNRFSRFSMATIVFSVLFIIGPHWNVQSQTPLPSTNSKNKSIDEIMQCYTENMGGKKAWSAVKSFHLQLLGKTNQKQALVDHYMLKPSSYKIAFHFPSGKRVLSYDGQSGHIQENGTWRPMPDDMQIEMHEEADFYDELIFYKEKEYALLPLPDTLISKKQYHKLALQKSQKDIQHYYINSDNCRLEMVEEFSEEKKYAGILFKTTFDDYQQVDGISFPFSMSLFGDNQLIVDYEVKNLTINPPLSKLDFSYRPE